MPTLTNRYNLHNLLSLNIITNSKKYQRCFESEYGRFSMPYSAPVYAPEVNVYLDNKLPKHKEHDTYNKVYFKKFFLCEYIIRDIFTKNVNVFFKISFFKKIYLEPYVKFLRSRIIHPLIYYKLIQKNVLFSGAGIAYKNKGYCLFALPETGKTSLCLSLLERGFQLLTDDWLFIDVDKMFLYGGQHPILISYYNIKNSNNYLLKILLSIKGIIYPLFEYLTGQRFFPRIRVKLEYIYPNIIISPPVQLKGILILQNIGINSKADICTKHNSNNISEHILESSISRQNLYTYIFLNDQNSIKISLSKEYELINKMQSNLTFIEYIQPHTMSPEETDRLAERLHSCK